MKINISIKSENGYKFYEVDGYLVFEMYGHKFVAHRGINIKNGKQFYIRQDWRISEAETGAVILTECYTFMGAIRESEEFLKNKGETAFMKAFESAKRRQNE